jgi:hypothetical protein
LYSGPVLFKGGSILAGGANITKITGFDGPVVFEDFDFSNCVSTVNLATVANIFPIVFRNCKLPASWSGSLNTLTPLYENGYAAMYNVDNAGTNYVMQYKDVGGSTVNETTITRVSGASNGATTISWKMVSGASTLYPYMWTQSPEIVIWNSRTAVAVTATIELVSSASVNNDDIWMELSYLSASGAPLGTLITSCKATFLTANAAITTSTAPWNSSPATPVYQKMSVSFTPQLAGFVHVVVKLAKASKTIYVDPLITLS